MEWRTRQRRLAKCMVWQATTEQSDCECTFGVFASRNKTAKAFWHALVVYHFVELKYFIGETPAIQPDVTILAVKRGVRVFFLNSLLDVPC